MKKLYVIDGHALCYRAYYAFINNPLRTKDGQDVSAIYGFARMLYKLISEQNPEYLVVTFDPPNRSFRWDIYPEYKANRNKTPDELRSQIDEIKNMVKAIGLPQYENERYEADDVMGSISDKYGKGDIQVVLVTGDKDAMQLVNDNVVMYVNKKGVSEYKIVDVEGVVEKLGLKPNEVIDYMAMVGDSSDNVPGVSGIGPKGAKNLINRFGTLDEIFNNLDSLTPRQKQQLIDSKESAYLSQDLVTIRRDVPVEIDFDSLNYDGLSSETAKEYFKNLGMYSMVGDFFGEESLKVESFDSSKVDYKLIKTEEQLKDVIVQVEKAGICAVDTETTSVNAMEAELLGISISISEKQGWYLPVLSVGLFGADYPDREVSLSLIKPLIENPEIKKIGQNIKYDILIFKNVDIEMKGVYFDTMIASYLLNPGERRHNMDDMAMSLLNYKTITYKELVGVGKNAISLSEVPLDKVCEYAIEDSDITLRLYNILEKRIKDEKLDKLFFEMEMPLVQVLVSMEFRGVKIDLEHFKKLAIENDEMLAEVESNIHKLADEDFNINSTKELARILFDKIGLKPVKKTKTGFSTDIKVLEALLGQHEIIENLIKYRTFAKLKSTYIDALPKLVNSKTGRIHTSYNQSVTATGRLSSSNPNLQNIPVRDEFGKKIRKGFVNENNYKIVSADYSQIELRLAAHISGDKAMIDAFNNDEDIHTKTAASVYEVDLNDVTEEMRRKAKVINFATIYGVSPYGLSQQAEIGVKEASIFIKKYFETYPGVKEYIDKTIEFAKESGYVETISGRKRNLPDINSNSKFPREGAERTAINTPIQGTSADMIKIAMINIEKEIVEKNLKSHMVMQVHDELVFEISDSEKEMMENLIREKMEGAIELSIAVKVDIGSGKNWEEAH